MYRAKETGGGRYQVFDHQLGDRAIERLRLEADLRSAIDSVEIRQRDQPVGLLDGQVAGFETLAR